MSERKYVVFKLGSEEYAIDITAVNTITDFNIKHSVPDTAEFVEGIINLRGQVIPIINLKKKFNMYHEKDAELNNSRILVTDIQDQRVGIMVDDASEVITIAEENIDNPPDIIMNDDTQFIQGIGKVNERLLIVIDFNRLLSIRERSQLKDFIGA